MRRSTLVKAASRAEAQGRLLQAARFYYTIARRSTDEKDIYLALESAYLCEHA